VPASSTRRDWQTEIWWCQPQALTVAFSIAGWVGEALQQSLALAPFLSLAFARHLGGQADELLHGEQAAAAVDQRPQAAMQLLTIVWRQNRIAAGLNLGGEMENGPLDTDGEHFAQHLQVQRQMAV
jgi:hypothetical protein